MGAATGVFENLKSLLFNGKFSDQKAKNRLQMVLVQDRSGLTTEDMEGFKKDLLEVIQKFFVLEHNELEVEWRRDKGSTAMFINTPVVTRPRQQKSAAA